MRIFYDCEFIDTGCKLELVSIALERDDGARYYAEPRDVNLSEASDWVDEHVIAYLDSQYPARDASSIEDAYELYIEKTKPRHVIADEIIKFVGDDDPEFYGYWDHYDWVLLSQLYGPLTERPAGWNWGSINLGVLAALMNMDPEKELPLETELDGFKHLPLHAHRADAGAAWTRLLYDRIAKVFRI